MISNAIKQHKNDTLDVSNEVYVHVHPISNLTHKHAQSLPLGSERAMTSNAISSIKMTRLMSAMSIYTCTSDL